MRIRGRLRRKPSGELRYDVEKLEEEPSKMEALVKGCELVTC